ncbi:spore germination protein [Desulfotomaculum sp. 1211_IL3151]|uniref:spore germination protein n=1 Tax=Desulfotomaculum sp. 1211_IL3151 TaxID=3084055 RepID=UPI003FA56793
MIPTTLLFTIANARKGTPFPALIEALIMVFAFEFLREAGIRLPHPVGQAISIVGALIMGDAAVAAGLVSASMVITSLDSGGRLSGTKSK